MVSLNKDCIILPLYLTMPWVGLQCVIVLFPDHTHFLLEAMTMKIIDTIALFGAYCICLTNAHISNLNKACNKI